ncbi:MAG: hypothetical protein E6713_10400 [Sporomusaceae bacterium]|nr:hypothetical protein [Sporomusaceae bacterium]
MVYYIDPNMPEWLDFVAMPGKGFLLVRLGAEDSFARRFVWHVKGCPRMAPIELSGVICECKRESCIGCSCNELNVRRIIAHEFLPEKKTALQRLLSELKKQTPCGSSIYQNIENVSNYLSLQDDKSKELLKELYC